MQQQLHNGVDIVVADGLVPIWHQDICNHHDDVARFAYIQSA